MRLMRQAMAVLGGVVAIAVIVALVTPKTAHALVATAVQVVNTSANPVPNLDVNTPAEEPLQTILCTSTGAFSGDCGSQANNFAVPSTTTDGLTVKRLVVENVSGSCVVGASTQVFGMGVTTTVNENVVNNQNDVAALIAVVNPFTFNSPTRLYADPRRDSGVGALCQRNRRPLQGRSQRLRNHEVGLG